MEKEKEPEPHTIFRPLAGCIKIMRLHNTDLESGFAYLRDFKPGKGAIFLYPTLIV
jgi:hypothetical protein